MDKIEKAISDLFPSKLVDMDQFEEWCRLLRTKAYSEAVNLKYFLELHLDKCKKENEKNDGVKRDYWELFGGAGETLIKSVKSIRSKLARDLVEAQTTERQTEDELRIRILGFGDLGRIRIVTDFLLDVDFLLSGMFNQEKFFLDKYKCPKGIKDFVFNANHRDGLKGHRARQFSVLAPYDGPDTFGFEVQLMTRLQHAWDRRNHPLYEWQREKLDWTEDQAAVVLAVNDLSCSETLHLVDQQADRNWRDFLIQRKERKQL